MTKEKFHAFVKVQASGRINMTDIVTGSRLAQIPESDYEDIMWNYDKYLKEFGYPKVEPKKKKMSASVTDDGVHKVGQKVNLVVRVPSFGLEKEIEGEVTKITCDYVTICYNSVEGPTTRRMRKQSWTSGRLWTHDIGCVMEEKR